jgi:hypothetical protein
MIFSCLGLSGVMTDLISARSNGASKPFPGLFRKPRRVSVTLPDSTARQLTERSLLEGRSLSNLAAVLLEKELCAGGDGPPLGAEPRLRSPG